MAQSGNKFYKKDIDLLYLAVYKTINFHKSINDTYKRKEYACDYI